MHFFFGTFNAFKKGTPLFLFLLIVFIAYFLMVIRFLKMLQIEAHEWVLLSKYSNMIRVWGETKLEEFNI